MDSERPRPVSLMKDFLGLYSDVSAEDCPPGGMQEQINILCVKQGELTTRGGLAVVTLTTLQEG